MVLPTWNPLDAFSFRIYLLSRASKIGSTRQVRSRRTTAREVDLHPEVPLLYLLVSGIRIDLIELVLVNALGSTSVATPLALPF